MSTLHPQFTAEIGGSPEIIFDLIADMPNYGRWLSGSEAFGATSRVTPYPVRLGTTYLDAGPAGQRPGSVTEYDPPRHIAFHHTMALRWGPLRADIEVRIRYTLQPADGATRVLRALDMTIQMPGMMKLAEPLVIWGFRRENVRILAELKRYVESRMQKRDPAVP
ncbi:MAG TPA: SRPBCC family protein [Terriglobales bacterium]|nr:SRPBCC family protein [Terriglobales bacterium]